MKRFSKLFFTVPLLVSGVVGACGDSDGSNHVSGSKKISDLTGDEVHALCEEQVRRLGKAAQSVSNEKACIWVAWQVGNSETCEELRDTCLESDPPGEDEVEEEPEDPCDQASATVLPECAGELTVGQWRDCQEAIFAATVEFYEGLSCESEPEEPPGEDLRACQEIAEKCPELLDM